MSVRDEVMQRENLPAKVSPKEVAERRIKAQLPTFADVLPKDFDVARWTTVVLTAIKATPDLLRCFETSDGTQSLLLACIQAATLGLEPNTPLGDAWLQPRNAKDERGQWHKEAELSVSYRGLTKLALQHPDVIQLVADVVREGDHFEYGRSLDDDQLEHRPAPKRGALTHAYAILRMRNGARDYVVLDESDIYRARASSPAWEKSASPWQKHPASMWQKTAIKRLCTSTPYRTVTLAQAVDVDERRLALDGEQIVAIEEAPEPLARLVVPSLGEAVAADNAEYDQMIAEVEVEPADAEVVNDYQSDVDPETGEMFAEPVTHPWAGWNRDQWASWGRQAGVKVTDLGKVRLQDWGSVANAPYDKQAQVYALGVPDGQPF